MICLIVAMAENRVIGDNGKIPWHIPGELAYFKRVTMGHAIVMGRRTYESIGRPLPGRTNYVLTREKEYDAPGCHVIHEIGTILSLAERETVFVIGGAEVYKQFMAYADRVYLTLIHHEFAGDTFFPEMDGEWRLVESNPQAGPVWPHTFNVYEKVR